MQLSVQNSNTFESIISNVIKLPIIKVDRREFLINAYSKYINSEEDINGLLANGPSYLGIDKNKVDKIAQKVIDKRVMLSSGVSFMAGLPGGLAMAATIPADGIQFFAVALMLAQEIAYLYGEKDIWSNNDNEMVREKVILYLGTMFGVAGASETIRIVSTRLSIEALKQLPKKSLTKGVIYPMVKTIGKFLGVKVTKDTFAKSVSKAIPIVGGIISGGMTFVSMRPMGNKLKEAFSKATFDYNEEELIRDINVVKNSIDIEDVEFSEIEEVAIDCEFNDSIDFQ